MSTSESCGIPIPLSVSGSHASSGSTPRMVWSGAGLTMLEAMLNCEGVRWISGSLLLFRIPDQYPSSACQQ
eukprot:3774321-Rhodomonas_salina.1